MGEINRRYRCEAPQCKQSLTHYFREPGTGVTWGVCRKHLERYIASEVLREGRTEIASDIDSHGFTVVSVVRSWSPTTDAALHDEGQSDG